MAKQKTEPVEREYIVPLREKCRPVPKYKKTPKAVKTLKEFIAKHMQVRDRDLKKIKIDGYLNEILWKRGIKKPLHKVKVKAVKEKDIVRVYAVELPEKIKFKKKRLEKQEVEAKVAAEKQKTLMEKAKEQMQGGGKTDEKPEEKPVEKVEEKKEEVKEKQESVKEKNKVESKKEHKDKKHTTKTKESGEPSYRTSKK